MPDEPASNISTVNASRIVPLDARRHAGLGISRSHFKHFMAMHNSVIISLTEFFYASQHYPVVFVKSAENTMQACAVTGLRQTENLYIDKQGNWLDYAYVPAYIRRFPFYTANTGNSLAAHKMMIMVDEAGLSESEDPFFDRSGKATEKWQMTEDFISDFTSSEQLTSTFIKKITGLGLLEAFDAQINPKMQKSMHITGIYRVNEDRLNRLSRKIIKDLMLQGELSRIYAHLISLENFAKLLDLSANKDRIATT